MNFGKYQLLKKLAVGGMAEIYLARQPGIAGFEKTLVIKRILPDIAVDPDFVSMFLDEARVAASMSHPALVQIFDLGQTDGSYFIAMEYIAGADLKQFVREHAQRQVHIPVEIAARIMATALEGLHYAHTLTSPDGRPLRLVHRDVTPSNILISYGGAVKMVDFGIAKAESQSVKTKAGTVKGKFPYLSPEQIAQEGIDARADVWAAGVCLFEMLTLRRLFKADNELAILKAILDAELPPPSSINPAVPPELDAIVAGCLTRDLSRRTESADVARRQLEAFLQSRPSATGATELAAYMQTFFAAEYSESNRVLATLSRSTSGEAPVVAQELPSRSIEGTPSWQSLPGAQVATKSHSLPESVSAPPLAEPGRAPAPAPADARGPGARKSPVVAVALGALALLAVAAGAWFATRPSSGALSIESTPSGAVVTVDGARRDGVTPLRLETLPFGAHVILVEKSGYEPATRQLTLNAQEPQATLTVALTPAAPQPAKLSVVTTPAGATLRLDETPLSGPTPIKDASVTAGAHRLVASLEGYAPAQSEFVAEPGSTTQLMLTLEPLQEPGPAVPDAGDAVAPPDDKKDPARTAKRFGSLSLNTVPDADVFLKGSKVGHTPLREVRVPAGELTLLFANDSVGLNQTAKLVVAPGGTTSKSITFGKGRLAVDVTPWADVFIGNKKLGTTPLSPREMYEGSYLVRLVNSEVGVIENVKVEIKPGQVSQLRYDWSNR